MPPNQEEKCSIPERVDVKKAIEIVQSLIPNAGRGLIAREDIKEGELIFSIPRPLIIVAHPNRKNEVCDNCFAIRKPQAQTVPISTDKLLGCGRCKQVYYCDKECQTCAWKHHHRFECKAFITLARTTIDDVEVLDLYGIKAFVRFKRLMRTGSEATTQEERAEFYALKSNQISLEKTEAFAEMMRFETAVVVRLLVPNLDNLEEVNENKKWQWYYCALSSNGLGVLLPVLKGRWHINDPECPAWTMAGTCLEPFAALLNHSCEANSSWAFDGVKLEVRAQKDIIAGEELTISYTNSGRDYTQRSQQLLSHYGFTCTCPLCKQGILNGPKATLTGDLREIIMTMIDIGDPETEHETKELTIVIAAVKAKGFGLDKWPNRPLHQMLLSGFLTLGNHNMALKISLILYYFIEPTQTPPTSRMERLETLSMLIQLLGPEQGDSSTPLLQELRFHLQFHLRDKYVKETHICYGAYSTVGVFEKESFEKALQALAEIAGPGIQFASIQEDKGEREEFVVHMNQLLQMTDLPTRTVKELFWDEISFDGTENLDVECITEGFEGLVFGE